MKKQAFQRMIDLLMSIGLILLMSYQRIGEATHEWLGVIVFLLFFLHHLLNKRWIKAMTLGSYSWVRIIQTGCVLLLFLCMMMLMISGMTLSRHVFDFLEFTGFSSMARTLHMLGAYWGFVFMSIHIGLHASMLLVRFYKISIIQAYKFIWNILFTLISLYGCYAFIEHDLLSYMVLKIEFVFFDPSVSLLLFFFDYLCMMIFFGSLTHILMTICRRNDTKPKRI